MEGVSQHQFKGIMGRLKALGIKNQNELGEAVEIGQTAVSAAKRRGSFPNRWTEVICEKYDITPSYLLLGREDQKFDDEFYCDNPDYIDVNPAYTQNRQVDTFNNTPDNRKSLVPVNHYTEDTDTMRDTMRHLNTLIDRLTADIAQRDREIERLKGELKKGIGNR